MSRRVWVITPTDTYDGVGGGYPTPAGACTDLGFVLDRASLDFDRDGVVVLAGVTRGQLRTDVPVSLWKDTLGPEAWTTFRPRYPLSRARVHLLLLDELVTGRSPLFDKATPPQTIAARLYGYHQATGAAFRMTPGVTGHAMLRERYFDPRPGHSPLWHYHGPVGRATGPLWWARKADDPTYPLAVKFDVRGAYAAAAGVVTLPWGGLELVDVPAFDRERAGYWLLPGESVSVAVAMWKNLFPGGPLPLDPRKALRSGAVWVTTPVMTLLNDYGVNPHVSEGYLAVDKFEHDGQEYDAGSRRLLRAWYEKLRDARRAAAQMVEVEQAVKRTVNEAVGLFGRAGGRIYRPDWQAFIIDQARANLLRKVYARWSGDQVWPLRVTGVDALWYPCAEGSTEAGMGEWIGDNLGALREVARIPMFDYVTAATQTPTTTSAGAR